MLLEQKQNPPRILGGLGWFAVWLSLQLSIRTPNPAPQQQRQQAQARWEQRTVICLPQ